MQRKKYKVTLYKNKEDIIHQQKNKKNSWNGQTYTVSYKADEYREYAKIKRNHKTFKKVSFMSYEA